MVEVLGSHSHDSVTTEAVGFQLDFDITECGLGVLGHAILGLP